MKKNLIHFALIVFGSALYTNLFWREELGVNALIFTLFAFGAAWWRWHEALQRKEVQLLIGGTLLSALLTVWHHSLLAKTAHILSFFLLIGYLQQEKVRFVVFAFLLGMTSILEGPMNLARNLRNSLPQRSSWQRAARWAQLTLLPVGLGVIFTLLYYHANPKFAQAFDFLWRRFSFSFQWTNLDEKMWPFIRGLFIMGGLLGASRLAPLAFDIEGKLPFNLNRRQKRFHLWKPGMLSLKNEYRAGLIAFGLLNGLLFLANIADLRYVWISYGDAGPEELSQYVHEGTFLLLLAILLAMGAVIWYFRGNLNFYPNNEWLRGLAFLWLAQNAMLALSVALRNWQYVAHYGLAYKRLGVFWFLCLVLYGLYTLFLKVKGCQSLAFLLHRNSWAIYTSLLILSFINWDLAITRYNLQANTRGEIDARFLTWEVSDKNLYLLLLHRGRLLERSGLDAEELEQALRDKQRAFVKRRQLLSWRSWNYADARNAQFLAEEQHLDQ